jgi:hypothetical protein
VADWSRYWRSAGEPLEAMHAHFQRHVYHRHSHETYSFGVTEDGVQSFNCRGSARASAAGMIMARRALRASPAARLNDVPGQ